MLKSENYLTFTKQYLEAKTLDADFTVNGMTVNLRKQYIQRPKSSYKVKYVKKEGRLDIVAIKEAIPERQLRLYNDTLRKIEEIYATMLRDERFDWFDEVRFLSGTFEEMVKKTGAILSKTDLLGVSTTTDGEIIFQKDVFAKIMQSQGLFLGSYKVFKSYCKHENFFDGCIWGFTSETINFVDTSIADPQYFEYA